MSVVNNHSKSYLGDFVLDMCFRKLSIVDIMSIFMRTAPELGAISCLEQL